MEIPITEIEHLAKLAKLMLLEKEKKQFSSDVSQIVDYFDQLNEIEPSKFSTPAVTVEAQWSDKKNGQALRSDKPTNIFDTEKTLAETPDLDRGQIKVKAVFDR